MMMKTCHHSSEKPSFEINLVENSSPQVHVPTCLQIDNDDDDADDDDDDDKYDDDNDSTWPLASLTRISTVSLNTLLPLQIYSDR